MRTRRRIEVSCRVEIEKTPASLHAHAIPDGIDLRPGDRVIVHGAPSDIAFGERISLVCRATVLRAGPIARAWTEMSAFFALTELYEVGFQPKELP